VSNALVVEISVFVRLPMKKDVEWHWQDYQIKSFVALKQLKDHVTADLALQQLMHLTKHSWPNNKSKVPALCSPYWTFATKLLTVMELSSRESILSYQSPCSLKY